MKYTFEQFTVANGETLSIFEEELSVIVPYYDSYHVDGEWIVLDDKNFGAKDFAHKVKISEHDFNEYLNECKRKEKERLERFAMMQEKFKMM